MKLQLNLIFVFNAFYLTQQTFECTYIEFRCGNRYVLPCELSVLQFDKRIIELSFFFIT